MFYYFQTSFVFCSAIFFISRFSFQGNAKKSLRISYAKIKPFQTDCHPFFKAKQRLKQQLAQGKV
jgi:hypothetical protein